jgi:hypothetical protein
LKNAVIPEIQRLWNVSSILDGERSKSSENPGFTLAIHRVATLPKDRKSSPFPTILSSPNEFTMLIACYR